MDEFAPPRRDEDIRREIIEELGFDPQLDACDIGVGVTDGAVVLTGTVSSYPERKAAEAAALRVRGVVAVAEDIRVDLADTARLDDAELARRIAHVLAWDPQLPHDSIRAEVRDGVVTLRGAVVWRHERALAAQGVGRIAGVRAIDNRLTIRPHPSHRDIEREILHALRRNADVEASTIAVEIHDGIVRLNGRVRAPYEKTLVHEAVWKAPGVVAIEDGLSVG